MAKKIVSLKIEIYPWQFIEKDFTQRELRVDVEVSNQPTAHYTKIIPENDLVSYFDIIFDEAKEQIKQALKGGQNEEPRSD